MDSKGLVALWREGLLAQKVLLGATKGYKSHPQLIRFKRAAEPVLAISNYLQHVANEAAKRNYKFNREKIATDTPCDRIRVSAGQLEYEFKHLLSKLKARAPDRFDELKSTREISPHPLFAVTEGEIEAWEKISN